MASEVANETARADTPLRWWGSHELASGDVALWHIGPLELWAQRLDHEWRIDTEWEDDPLLERCHSEVPRAVAGLPDQDEDASRFGFSESPAAVELLPALADRPVILRPEHTLYVPAGEAVRLYVGLPAWVQVRLGGVFAHEVPAFRPSDTWFGPDTMAGELCYAGRTRARFAIEDVVRRPHRVLTEITLDNRADDVLCVERISLPVQHLSLFADATDQLWTESITLRRQESGEQASVRIGQAPPDAAGDVEHVASAREAAGANLVVRAFEALMAGVRG
jgi:hypothetical protein